jgi:Transposase
MGETIKIVDGHGFAVFLGLDVGKGVHHAVALTPDGARLHDGELPQDEARLRALFANWPSTGVC